MATASASAPQFTVTGQVKTTVLGPNQQAMQVWQVSFTTPAGDSGFVDVPLAAYNAGNVAAMILADVETINAVRGLGQ